MWLGSDKFPFYAGEVYHQVFLFFLITAKPRVE